MKLGPTGPCPKCGGKVWDGPRYDYSFNKLAYTCTDCRYATYVAPLDQQATPAGWDALENQR